jgi:signal transduction histidine kinase/DNA-binding response OmpR family regulator
MTAVWRERTNWKVTARLVSCTKDPPQYVLLLFHFTGFTALSLHRLTAPDDRDRLQHQPGGGMDEGDVSSTAVETTPDDIAVDPSLPAGAGLLNFAQDVFDTVHEPLLVLDASLRVRTANSAFYRTFGLLPGDTEARLVDEIGDGQWGGSDLRTLLDDIVPNDSDFNEFVLEREFGSAGSRILLLNGRRLHDDLILLAMEDVTERRQVQELVVQMESYAQDVVDTVRESLLILDSGLRVHSANRAFYQTFRVSPEETENHLIYELGNGQWDIPDLRTLLEDIVPMSSVFNDFELEHDFPAIGRRVMLLNARRLRPGSHAELLVLALEDVTERRRVEGEVAKAKQAAEEANRTKSLFLANMSHELRTPLNAILGFSEMLQEDVVERKVPELAADLQKISTAGNHLLRLINDILDLSKIEAGKMDMHLERFGVLELVDEVASTVNLQVARNGNALVVNAAPDIGFMYSDLDKVRQGLFNLASNAAKFTHGGRIEITAERQLTDGVEWMVFKVADTGIGLSPDQIVRLFQPFTQADASTTRRFGGTGLGLALTRRFCQMMKGDVTLSSTPGEGSVFTMILPAIAREATATSAERPAERRKTAYVPAHALLKEGAALPPIGTCVLVIDDDAMQRDLMERYLGKEGFTVRTANGGAEGLALAKQLVPAAITLDVMMPDMDGWTVLSALKEDLVLRDVPVIMLTMVDDPVRGFTLGASEYATKPVNRRRLSQMLKKFTCVQPPCPVLVIDDDASARALVRTFLEREGWAVTEAENGVEALARMRIERPSLIFLDLMMPEMDGFAFASEVRRHPEWRSIPIVVVTARDLTQDDRKRLNGNVETIIRKSGESREVLLEQVRDLLAASPATRVPVKEGQ